MASATMTPAKAESKPMSENTNQALEKPAEKTPEIITTPQEYRGAHLLWKQRQFNVLTPFVNISGLAPQHGIFTSVIQIDPAKAAGQAYDGLPFLKAGEVALAKNGLRTIAEGLGISVRLEYISTGVIRHYWHVKAIASYRGLDGGIVTREASEEWDLRDGSDRLKGWQGNQLSEGRKHGLRNCETRAINAAIRECGCGLKQAYLRSELAQPFIACRVAVVPNMEDPEQRRIVLERSLGSTNVLYPHTARELPPATHDQGDDEPRHIGSGSTTPAPQPKPAEPAAPTYPDGYGLIRGIEEKDVPKRAGGSFKKWTIVDWQGVPHVTTKREFVDKLRACQDQKLAVDINSEENEYQESVITEFFVHDPRQPSLLPDPKNGL